MMTLNIYGQYAWHTEAKIVGNKEALVALQSAIAKALAHGRAMLGSERSGHDTKPLFASDGEGYELEVICLDDKSEEWRNYQPEYTVFM